jgi:hypothetical protein
MLLFLSGQVNRWAWLHKNLKCNHIAVRLNQTSYLKVAYSAPIAHKRQRGQPKKTVGCFARQPNELEFGIELPSSDEDRDTPFGHLAMQPSEAV